MQRISTYMPLMDNRYRMGERDFRMNQIAKRSSSSRAIGELREKPVDAANITRLDSSIGRSNQYLKNIDYLKGHWQQAEGYMNEAVSIVQRLRELTIQAAAGTYSGEDLNYMALEVDALISELSLVANSRDGTGKYLFSGDKVDVPPYAVSLERVPGMERSAITQINYAGSLSRSHVETTDGQTIRANLQGNEVFWSEQQQVFGAVSTDNFTVDTRNRFSIDGAEIVLEPGDNVQSVIRKINASGAAVKAFLDPVTASLNLETTIAHQIWIEPQEGKALVELGLLSEEGSQSPPANWNIDATVTGGSLFDQVIALREAMVSNDHERIGGAILGGIDKGLNGLLRNLSDLGARNERLQFSVSRTGEEILAMSDWKSKLADIDMTQAITEMKMIEYTQKAAYQIAGRILQPTLMDFLR